MFHRPCKGGHASHRWCASSRRHTLRKSSDEQTEGALRNEAHRAIAAMKMLFINRPYRKTNKPQVRRLIDKRPDDKEPSRDGNLPRHQARPHHLCPAQHRLFRRAGAVVDLWFAATAADLGQGAAPRQRYPAAGLRPVPGAGKRPVSLPATLADRQAGGIGRLYPARHHGDQARQDTADSRPVRPAGNRCVWLHDRGGLLPLAAALCLNPGPGVARRGHRRRQGAGLGCPAWMASIAESTSGPSTTWAASMSAASCAMVVAPIMVLVTKVRLRT